jgi:hypothetical protein
LPLPIWSVLVLVFVAACFTPPFEAARAALLPTVVPRDLYRDAIALTQLTFEAMLLVGYLSGGGLSALLSPEGALALNAATFVASAAVLLGMRAGRTPAASVEEPTGVRAGLRAVFGEPFVRRYTISYSIVGACAIVGEALAAAYAREELVSPTADDVSRTVAGLAGLLAAAVPLGVIVATLALPKRADDTGAMRLAGTVALIGTLGALVGFLLDPSMPFVLLPYAMLGVVFASRIPGNQVAGLRIPDPVRASAFGILNGLMMTAMGLAALLGGALGDRIGVRMACVAFLAVGTAVALQAAVAPPRDPAGPEPGRVAPTTAT